MAEEAQLVGEESWETHRASKNLCSTSDRIFIVVVQSLRHVPLFVTPWTAAHQASPSFTISWSLLKFMSIESVMPSNHLILCCPLLILPSIILSIRVFSNESILYIRWPKYWSFSFSINPSNDYSELISFRINWFDLPAVQGTLKSLLQHHSLKALILQHSAFFTVQLSHSVQISHSVGSASASVLPMNIQDWFPLGWVGLISLLLSKGLSRVFYNTKFKSIKSLALSFPSSIHHHYWKNDSFD